ncbi:WXG100 family type VII secretion target [Micromonospora sp. WMMD1219]|uniref:WXG100 family type VII secretion target n=1 Tax=Micromonospora sp. WMMD1219 TaxID=3404115 RepID=UPI003BF5AA92
MVDPSGSNLRVPAELELAGQTLNNKAEVIVEQLDTLIRTLSPLLDEAASAKYDAAAAADGWQGSAQSYYSGLQGEWNIAANGLFGETGVLGVIASALNLSWNNYMEGEWANVRTWRP